MPPPERRTQHAQHRGGQQGEEPADHDGDHQHRYHVGQGLPGSGGRGQVLGGLLQGQCVHATYSSHSGPWERAVFFAALPTLLVRRRFPWLPVLAAPLLCFDPAAVLPVVVVCYTAGRQWGPRWRTLASFVLTASSVTIAAWDPKPNDGVLYQLLVPSAWLAASLLVGLWMHQRQTLLDALRDRAAQAERNSELLSERAVVAERRRIAREMHDVVAHRVSTIALQAGALTMTALDERTVETAEVIRSTSATALTELREILDVLRQDEQDPKDHSERISSLTGVRTDGSVLADVEALVRDCVAAGTAIRLEAPADLPEVPGPGS